MIICTVKIFQINDGTLDQSMNFLIRGSLSTAISENVTFSPSNRTTTTSKRVSVNAESSAYLEKLDKITETLHVSRCRLEMRIIKARNISVKSGMTINPFIQLQVGHSIVRTASNEVASNDVEFNEFK